MDVGVKMELVSVIVIMDKIKLNITNKDLPNYKFEDHYPTFIDCMSAIGRTLEHHKDSSKINISMEKVSQ